MAIWPNLGREIRKFLFLAGPRLRGQRAGFWRWRLPLQNSGLRFKFHQLQLQVPSLPLWNLKTNDVILYGKTHSFVFRSLFVLVRNYQQNNQQRTGNERYEFKQLKNPLFRPVHWVKVLSLSLWTLNGCILFQNDQCSRPVASGICFWLHHSFFELTH